MRKAIVTVLLAGLVAGVPGSAAAGRTKTIHKEFSAGPLAPMPNVAEDVGHSCLTGAEGVHKSTVAFKTPGRGTLQVSVGEFDGDWDLYVLDSSGNRIGTSEASQIQGAPQEESLTLKLAAKKTYSIVACNFAGGPTAAGHYMYKYRR